MGIFLVDNYRKTLELFPRMKVFLVASLAIAGVIGVPSSRDSCPTLEQIGQWFENEFDTQIPDGIIDCVHNGENCPFEDFGEFQDWFHSTTGFEIPIPDEAFMKEMVAQAKRRLSPLSKRSLNLISMTSSCQQSTIVPRILLNSLDLVTSLTISTN